MTVVMKACSWSTHQPAHSQERVRHFPMAALQGGVCREGLAGTKAKAFVTWPLCDMPPSSFLPIPAGCCRSEKPHGSGGMQMMQMTGVPAQLLHVAASKARLPWYGLPNDPGSHSYFKQDTFNLNQN